MSENKEPTGNDFHSENIRKKMKGVRGNYHTLPDWRECYDWPDGFAPIQEWRKYPWRPKRDFTRER